MSLKAVVQDLTIMAATRMSTILFLLFIGIGLVFAAPQQVPILSQTQDGPNLDGSYQFSYQTGDGKNVQERGYQIYAGTPEEGSAKEGSYSYTAPDGRVISVQYVANDKGFNVKISK